MEKKRALLPSLLTTGILVLSVLAWTQGLELSSSVLDPPGDQHSTNPTSANNPTRYNLNTGAAFTISCTFTYTSDAFTVSFYKDGVVISAGDLEETMLTETETDLLPDIEKMLQLQFLNFQPVHDGVYHCFGSTSDTNEVESSDMYLYGSEDPPPLPVRETPRYVVLDTSADLVLEARFRGNFYSNDWVYSEDDLTFMTNPTSVSDPAATTPVTMTDVGQTYTIPAGSASLVAGYYGPSILPTEAGVPILPTPENTVIVGSFVTPTVLINGAATVGEDVTFTCTGRGFPETILNIELSGVTASYTIGDQILMTEATPTSFMEVTRTVTLHSVTALDCGAVVMCVGSNMNSDGSTHTDQAEATLQVQVGVTPSEPLLSVGDPLTLTCTGEDCVDTTTTFTFSWFFNGSPVEASLVTTVDSTSQLSVTSVTSADFGTYTCQAMSVHGTGTAVAYVRERGSLVFTTDLTAPPMAPLHSSLSVMDGETNRYNIEPNAAFSLTCTAESPDDEDFTLTVSRMPSSVTSAFTHSVTESITTMPTTFVMTQTLNYSPFTSDLNGIYWCRADSSTTSNVLESRRILLGTGPAAMTRVSDLYIELIPPNPLELQVMVAGAYETLSWSRGGMELGNDLVNFTNFRQTLSISSTSSGDAGEYTAAVSASDSVTFQVQEFSAPQGTLTVPTYVIQGDTLTVNCSVMSFPQSSVSLSFGDTPIVTNISEAYDSTAGSFIYFTTHSTTAMHPSDEGNYTCSATITHGQPAVTELYSEAVFVAVYVPPEVNSTAESVAVDETNPAVLTCVATGIPAPSISWFIDPSMPINSDDIKYTISNTTRVLDSQNIEVTSTLTVSDTSVDDSGTYGCESVNLAGSAVDTAELTVQAAPLLLTITASPSTGVSQGMPLNLTCEAVGGPTISMTWTTPTGPRLGSVISIDSVTADNAGDYTCEVTSEDRTANGSITIGVRAEIDVSSFQDLYAVNEGQNVTFSCRAYGVPAPSLSWRRDGVELSPSSDSRVVLLPEVTTLVDYMGPVYRTMRMLTFTNVMDNDTRNTPGGMYQCVAVNTVGESSSLEKFEDVKNFTLFVRVAPTFIQDLAPMNVTFPAPLKLACTATARPRPSITWYKDGVELMEGGQVSITSKEEGERVRESTLTVSSPFLEGIGSYTCMAENVVDTANSTAEVVIFSQPFIRDPPVDLTVNQSSPATFSCTAQGSPVPTISWTGPSDSFTTEGTPGANFTVLSVLTIDSAVRALHEGLYTCSASNDVGPSPNSSATLTVQVPPTVQAVQERIVGIELMSATLTFTISDASPEVQTQNIQWTFRDFNRDSFDIPSDSLTTTFSSLMGVFRDDRLSLTLSGLNNDFEGTYTMTATNEAGSNSAIVELVVEGPPRIITPPVNRQVVNGTDITFDCYALAEPLHSLTWYFISVNGSNTTIGSVNGTENMITDNKKYQITDNSASSNDYGRLLVRDVQFEDRGTYTCLAENRHGPDTASAPLSVQVPPVFLSTSPRVDVVMNSTDAVILNCSTRGYPISTLRWRKDGTQIDPDGFHINITTFRRQDPMDTYPFSSTMDSSFQPIPVEDLEYFEAVSELTLVPPLLLTDTASYTCEVESDFVQRFTETSDKIPVIIIELPREYTANIKLILGPVSDCPAWVDSNTEAKLSDISAALSVPLQRGCSCPLSVQQSLFSCVGTEGSQTAVFLAELSYIALPGAVNVPSLLASWLASDPVLTVASTQLQVDTACPVQVNSSDGQTCAPTSTSTPTVPFTATSANIVVYVLVVIDLVFVSTLALIVLLLFIICHRLRKNKLQYHGRRSRSPSEEEQEYDGPGYMVMENLTKSSEVPDLVEAESPLGTDY